ncbi:ATP phosphoribosyltransferase regulatory subunit [Pseudohoeflea coraliihabitans]|uniref:ATP phosphoribosyltransferase regulatory subunit n=1 Tax=Pseudohoeflea coraliihabitans TaxID=2860393 RepID=A0ABS6WMD9_9HYPH|nr:ATP phosphoribosyltransferase regulatory subunit [Pseudohoeflea sp. DP4N28-3]MBW3097108.1 ATP phosphoribosyltransferase regulatory subunit [Pseudohoeflea sp. DP4N28-3]
MPQQLSAALAPGLGAASWPDFADTMLARMAALEASLIDIAVIQPAEPFLDMAGEDLRRRIFLTENEQGDSLCLRPEFTIPVCRSHIEQAFSTPRRYAYFGQVFRQRRQGDSAFYQGGIEDLGHADRPAADARAIAEALDLLAAVVPAEQLTVTLGDQAIFESVVAGLGVPAGWQARLVHAFGDADALEQTMARLASPPQTGLSDKTAAALVDRGDQAALARHIAAVMTDQGLSLSAGRTPDEIAARLLAKRLLERTRLSAPALAALKRFLALETPLSQATARLQAFADEVGLDITSALEPFSARCDRLAGKGIDLDGMTWRAAFGRPLDYYTGLVFEVSSRLEGAVLAGGGRYDRMMTLLGAAQPIPAVGFALWIDRIAAARSGS